ncbi:hypothetical protein ALC56_06631 [Trachymyrmex septentrionalis]|uniref:Uncharacterized protein n=1 Tax=Trachymyrmex septentrionalis TaxID=34720 RepID=A0A151JWT6_9HYME|nr:hypothetical protein ALC56_06631 [Trachymyrmex septentrionalis]
MDNGSFMRSWFVFKVALVRKFTSIFQGYNVTNAQHLRAVNDSQIKVIGLSDLRIRTILNHFEELEHDKFTLIEGLVYKKDNYKSRFYVPDCMVIPTLKITNIGNDENT